MAVSQLILGNSSPSWGQTDKIVIFKWTAKLVISPHEGLHLPRIPLERHLMNANSYFSLSFTASFPRRPCFLWSLSFIGRQRNVPKREKHELRFCEKLKHITMNFNFFSFASTPGSSTITIFKRKNTRNYHSIVPLTNAKRRQDEGNT